MSITNTFNEVEIECFDESDSQPARVVIRDLGFVVATLVVSVQDDCVRFTQIPNGQGYERRVNVDLNKIGYDSLTTSQSKGFGTITEEDWSPEKVEKVSTKLALIHSEVSEALEECARAITYQSSWVS